MILNLMSNVFSFFVNLRNSAFDKGKLKIISTNAKVISIGNLIAGGSGKTPLTIKIANQLKSNFNIGIVGRGYGRTTKGMILIDDINKFDGSEVGDEMLLIAKKTNLPVCLDEKKYKAAQEIDKNKNINLIIIDDGYQHRYIKRNVDILLINQKTLDNPYPFPKGHLREKFENYKRADIILLEEGINKSKLDFPNNDIYFYKKYFIGVKSYSIKKIYYLTKYNSTALLISSIANPDNFRNFVNSVGFELKDIIYFNDHYIYKDDDIDKIIERCKILKINNIITTEKDLVKLEKYKNKLFQNEINILVLEIDIKIENEDKFFENIINKLNSD